MDWPGTGLLCWPDIKSVSVVAFLSQDVTRLGASKCMTWQRERVHTWAWGKWVCERERERDGRKWEWEWNWTWGIAAVDSESEKDPKVFELAWNKRVIECKGGYSKNQFLTINPLSLSPSLPPSLSPTPSLCLSSPHRSFLVFACGKLGFGQKTAKIFFQCPSLTFAVHQKCSNWSKREKERKLIDFCSFECDSVGVFKKL